jgi:DNA-binding NarL/FixJ family response regulator
MTSRRIVVASRWPLLRVALESLFADAEGLDVVAAAGDWADTLEMVRRHRPDALAVACIVSGQKDTILSLRKLERRLECRTVVVGPAEPPAPVWWMMIAGISGYVTLEQPPQEIVEAVRSAATGSHVYGGTASPIANALSWGKRPGWASLSPRELDATRLVARGCSDVEIASALGVGSATVVKHIGRAMRKLECQDRVELVAKLFAAGVLGAADMDDRASA